MVVVAVVIVIVIIIISIIVGSKFGSSVRAFFFNTNTNCENRADVLCLNAGSSLRARNCRMSAARPAQVARRTRLDARWVFLNDGSLSGGILRPMHAWHLERGQEV